MRRDRVFRVTLFARRRVLANKRVFARSLHLFDDNVAVAVLPSNIGAWFFMRLLPPMFRVD